MSDAEQADDTGDVPEGAAVFPAIPAELGVHPLLLAVLHATIFLAGSDERIVNGEAGDEAVQQIAEYLQRLADADLRRAQEDMACLTAYARQQRWPRGLVQSLKTFLADLGVEPVEGEES
jgi:hypothetical protein